MARLARFFLPNQPIHVIHRGKDGRRVFFGKGDYERYRGWLAEAAEKYGCAIHAYVLMPNHVHLLATPRTLFRFYFLGTFACLVLMIVALLASFMRGGTKIEAASSAGTL